MKVPQAEIEFVDGLVQSVTDLGLLYREHLADNDFLLPHVFLADVARYVLEAANSSGSSRAAGRVLDTIESALAAANPVVEDLVTVSFAENVAWETNVDQVVDLAGPRLRNLVGRVKSNEDGAR